jgi:hypothetical protein
MKLTFMNFYVRFSLTILRNLSKSLVSLLPFLLFNLFPLQGLPHREPVVDVQEELGLLRPRDDAHRPHAHLGLRQDGRRVQGNVQ